MGQRSQIYIQMPNIGKAWAKKLNFSSKKEWRNKLPEFIKNQEIYEKWKAMYGTKDTIIVAFHHQWLYGRSFALMASQVLFVVKKFHTDAYGYGNPLHEKYDRMENPHDVIEWFKNYMQNLFDFELGKYARNSVEHLCLLNEEHIDDNDLSYSKSFTIGDNNDGVLIMDFTLKIPKYCFVNIEGDSTVEKIKRMTPVGASVYLKAYYPENENDCSEDELKRVIGGEKPINFKQNLIINKKFLKRFKDFEVLTVGELGDIFPQNRGELKMAQRETAELVAKRNEVVVDVH